MLKPYVLKTNLGILGSFLFLGAGYSIGDMNNILGIVLVLFGAVFWFYGLAAYARGKGHSAWHALAGIFYLLGLVYLFRLKDRHPSGSSPETPLQPQEARRTFAVVFNVLLDCFLFIYFAAIAGFLAGPVMQAVLLRGLPQTPAGLQKLMEALAESGPFFLVSAIAYSVMKRLWRLQVSGAILQAFICVVLMAAGFPWATPLAAAGLFLIFFTKGATLKALGFASAAGAAAAVALYVFHFVWIFDFKAGFEIGGKYLQNVAAVPEQKNSSKAARPPVPVKVPKPLLKKEEPPTHALLLQSGKRVEGSSFREENGYYLTIPGMGEVYFGKNEVTSVETL